jgi:hypothetical protein
MTDQCDKIGQFSPFGLLLEVHCDFFGKLKQTKLIVTFLATFC